MPRLRPVCPAEMDGRVEVLGRETKLPVLAAKFTTRDGCSAAK